MNPTNDYYDKMADTMMKANADMNIMMRDWLNAWLQSATIYTKGCEDMCESMTNIMQKTMENGMTASKNMANVKNPNDMMDMNVNMLKGNFDYLMSEVNRLMMTSSRLAQEWAEPMTQNMNATIIKLSRVRAA